MLRNIRTRYFAHGLGFLVSIGFPLVHIGILLGLNAFFDRAAPYGDSLTMFYATGLLPFISWMYLMRFTMTTVLSTRPLLAFPAVKIVDLLLAGAILEVLATCFSAILLGLVLTALGIDIIPPDPVQAALAFGMALLIGFGSGILCALLMMALPMLGVALGLMVIFAYMISGIFYMPETIPEPARYYISFNPILQTVEWMRSAYYEGYGAVLDKPYTVAVGVVLVFLGLAVERMFRGRFLVLTR